MLGRFQKSLASFSLGELLLLGSSSAFAMGVGYLVVSDFSLVSGSYAAKGDAIAVVDRSVNIVKRRPAGLPVWDEIKDETTLFERDQIFTDAGSYVTITFNNQDSIEIEENALVVIERFEGMTTVDIKRGTILAETKSQSPNLQVKVGDAKATLQGGGSKAVIKSDDGSQQSSISVIEGKAAVENKQGKIAADKNEEITIETNAKIIKKEKPKIDAFPAVLQKSGAYRLGWGQSKGADQYRVQLANDRNFNNMVVDTKTSKLAALTPRDLDGMHFWRVGVFDSEDNQWIFSIAEKISFRKIEAPILKWPVSDKEFTPKDAESIVTYIDWQEDSELDSYRYEIATDPEFKNLIAGRVTPEPPEQTPELPPGEYYWRVRTVDGSERQSAWSEARRFKVGEVQRTPKQVEIAMGQLTRVGNDKKVVSINWLPMKAAKGYRLEFSDSQDFSKTLYAETLDSDQTGFRWEVDRLGKIHWRVGPMGVRGGVFSSTQTVEVVPVASKALTPEEGYTQDFKKNTLVFTWEERLKAFAYEVQISRESEFKELVVAKASSKAQAMLELKKPGPYYWRVVTRYQYQGEEISRMSDPARFVLIGKEKPLPAPVIVSPVKTSILIGQENNQPKTFAFSWKKMPELVEYQVQLSVEPNFESPAADIKVTNSETSFNLVPGRYFWRVRGRTQERSTLWSPPVALRVRRPLPRPLLSASASELIAEAGKSAPVSFKWQRLPDADAYAFEIAKDEGFQQKVAKSTQPDLAYAKDLSYGNYYGRVAGINKQGVRGPWSESVRVAVLAPRISESINLQEPSPDAVIRYRMINPRVKLGWSGAEGAAKYELQVASDSQFASLMHEKTLSSTEASFVFDKGQYNWRVRGIAADGKPGPWSAMNDFSVEINNETPELVMPREGMVVDFDSSERRSLEFEWTNVDDLDNVVILVSKDRNLAKLVGKISAKSQTTKLYLPDDGAYYWRVRGRDKREKVAVLSPVQEFSVTTTAVKPPLEFDRTFRVEAGYAPIGINFKHSGIQQESLSDGSAAEKQNIDFDVWFKRAYILALRGWFNNEWGFEAEFSRRYEEGQIENDNAEEPQSLFFNIVESGGAFRRRWQPWNSFPVNLGLRFGYYYHPVLTFFHDGDTQSFGLASSDAHNATFGFETAVPLGGGFSVETKFDYLYLISGAPVTFTRAEHYYANMSILHHFFRRYVMTYTGSYRHQSYSYEDQINLYEGTIRSRILGFIWGLGWIF